MIFSTLSLVTTTLIGAYPAAIVFPIKIKSGFTPSQSQQYIFPLLPVQQYTSSRIRCTWYLSHTSRTYCQYLGAGGTSPTNPPIIVSATKAATLSGPISKILFSNSCAARFAYSSNVSSALIMCLG